MTGTHFKTGKRRDPVNYKLISLISVPSKVVEQILQESMTKHMQNTEILSDSHHASMRARCAWQVWWPSMTGLQCWWVRKEQLTSYTWICTKHLRLSWTTSLSLNWRGMNLTGVWLSNKQLSGWSQPQLWPMAPCLDGDQLWGGSIRGLF